MRSIQLGELLKEQDVTKIVYSRYRVKLTLSNIKNDLLSYHTQGTACLMFNSTVKHADFQLWFGYSDRCKGIAAKTATSPTAPAEPWNMRSKHK